ncbi:hypothetical protein DY000_02040087 [Brassica cretica]|uniref:Uncharacterized protein n=1 Tax=Brassica cretica TaxID=69181 RepID=A0ABQ7BCD2_BRACR|nr:hypothetical protein DY000_02040087 [Brassica cretica]
MFLRGINAFLQFACNQADYEERQTHGEKFYTVGESSGADQSTGEEEMWENPTWNAHEDHYQDNTVLQTFMMLNCETFAPYGSATVSHAFSWLRGKGFISIFPFFSTRSKKIKTHSRVATDESRRLLRFQFSPSPIPSLAVSRLPLTFLKMNSARVPGTTAAPLRMPPGATGPASNHSTSSSRSNSYPQKTLNAMLNSPARLAQPHLHPDKINGALWFGIDPCVNSFIRATWQAYYMGPWKSWRKVPDERRESW